MARDKIEYDFSDDNFGITGLRITLWMIRAVLVAIIVVSAWSYNETQDFFSGNDVEWLTFYGIGLISHSMSILFQYGQSPLFYLFLRFWKRTSMRKATLQQHQFNQNANAGQVAKYKNLFIQDLITAVVFFLAWALFCFVDGGSNVIQVQKNIYETHWSELVMHIVAIGSVFIEELFMFILDVGKSLGNYVENLSASLPPKPSFGERFINGVLGLRKVVSSVSQPSQPARQYSSAPKTPVYDTPRSGSTSPYRPAPIAGVQRGFHGLPPSTATNPEEPTYTDFG